MADDNDDVLSLSNSGCEDNLDSDLEAIFGNNTKIITTRAESNDKSKGRIIKGSSLPAKRKLQGRNKTGPKPKTAQPTGNKFNKNNIVELKQQLGIDSLVTTTSSLAEIVKKQSSVVHTSSCCREYRTTSV